MIILHLLSALGLLIISGYLFLIPFIYSPDRQEEKGQPVLVLLGLFLGFILFSGVFQLGSRGTVPDPVLWKLGATFLGGACSIVGGLARFRGGLPLALYSVAQLGAFSLFLFAFYWGMAGF